ncbi:MAG: MBL fold metallo-hydrolase [Candidatus Kariarchaeaceae archaeon]
MVIGSDDKIEVINSLYSTDLNENEVIFIFLGYSGILLRSKDLVILFDPGKGLSQTEIKALKHLDLLFFTHNHWDHFNKELALQIIDQTGAHVVADVISAEELKENIPHDQMTIGNSFDKITQIENKEFVALQGIHVGPITQYLVTCGEAKVFHGGDSGFWRHKNKSADLAFVPVGTATTCSPEVALAMVVNLQAKLVVPIHGRKQEMIKFKKLVEKILPDTEVIVPEKFIPITLVAI